MGIAEFFKSHVDDDTFYRGVSFAISTGWDRCVDARRVMHSFSSPRSVLAIAKVCRWAIHSPPKCTLTTCLSFDLLDHTMAFFDARELFNFARSCKTFAMAVATALDPAHTRATRRRLEHSALRNGVGNTTQCSEFVNELDVGLFMLDYILHANVHRFGTGLERRACLNALTGFHVSGGTKTSIAVRACNPNVEYNEEDIAAVSPSGQLVLAFHGNYVYLLQTLDEPIQGYSVVAREAVELGLEVSTSWDTTTGLRVVVCQPRKKRYTSICVANR